MAKVTVYKVQKYNLITDEMVLSRRMATREGARRMCAWVIESTAREIDESDLETGEQWTPKDYGIISDLTRPW